MAENNHCRQTVGTDQLIAREISATAEIYRVHVRGHLDDSWSDWLGGFAVARLDDGTSVLVGPVVDQAALHGLLARIRDVGLPLLAVDCTTQSIEPTPSDAPEGADSSE